MLKIKYTELKDLIANKKFIRVQSIGGEYDSSSNYWETVIYKDVDTNKYYAIGFLDGKICRSGNQEELTLGEVTRNIEEEYWEHI